MREELRELRESLARRRAEQHQGSARGDVDAPEADAAGDAQHFAASAQKAARVANRVATHSIKITHHAQQALKTAKNAIHDARVDSEGLSEAQKDYLKAAEAHLRTATQKAEYGRLQDLKATGGSDGEEQLTSRLQKLQDELDSKKGADRDSIAGMREELRTLREELAKKQAKHQSLGDAGSVHYKSGNGAPQSMEELREDLEAAEAELKIAEENAAKGIPPPPGTMSIDEMKAEIERLREAIQRIEIRELQKKKEEQAVVATNTKSLEEELPGRSRTVYRTPYETQSADSGSVNTKGLDIDTEMPYGELEPFGREDTAQELTEQSVRESDEMVDQLERAEVAEEKRSVFRALTRLRGAAITSYDGIARAQTGNIDEYNKTHKWRKTHPLHHLADEESDISKWAFPDNADF